MGQDVMTLPQWAGVALDLAIVASATVLAAMHVIQAETYLMVIGPIVGARAATIRSGRGDSGSAALAVVVGLSLGVASLLHNRNG